MKNEDLTELTVAELNQELEQAHQELFNLRFQLAIGRLKNYQRISQLRRDIARIKTEQSQRRLEAKAQPQEAEA
jgi:large subunit ribosomal protein L29